MLERGDVYLITGRRPSSTLTGREPVHALSGSEPGT